MECRVPALTQFALATQVFSITRLGMLRPVMGSSAIAIHFSADATAGTIHVHRNPGEIHPRPQMRLYLVSFNFGEMVVMLHPKNRSWRI